MRFGPAHMRGQAFIEHTTLVNLSETGLAFLTDRGSELKVGDIIKVEIPVPESDQIAWFARVVRIEEYESRRWFFSRENVVHPVQLLVALRFEELPEGHTKNIRKGIEKSFLKALQDQQVRRMVYYKALVLQNILPIIFYFFLTISAIGLVYWLSRPSSNYDKDRGAPWGERFKF